MQHMDERMTVTATDGAEFDGLLYLPQRTPAPGIVMVPEIFGSTPAMRAAAQHYAEAGYIVLLLDIFWRQERHLDLPYDKGAEASRHHNAFDYDTGALDVQRAIETLRARTQCTGHVGVVGFCLGGTMAYLAAARSNADVCVSFYGTRIQNFLADGPRITQPLLLHFGEKDHFTPPDVIAAIRAATAGNDRVQSFVYPGANHAFGNAFHPNYDAAATKLSEERTFAFLKPVLV